MLILPPFHVGFKQFSNIFRNVATWLPAATSFAVAEVAAREAVTVRVCDMLATWLPRFSEIRNRHFSFRQKIAAKPAQLLGFSAIRFQLVFNGFEGRAGSGLTACAQPCTWWYTKKIIPMRNCSVSHRDSIMGGCLNPAPARRWTGCHNQQMYCACTGAVTGRTVAHRQRRYGLQLSASAVPDRLRTRPSMH